MQNYHKHTSYSNVLVTDCAASYEEYIQRAVELGQNVISSVEHGYQGNYYVPYELVQKHNDKLLKDVESGLLTKEQFEKKKLKFVFGAEAYWVKDRLAEYSKIDKKTGKEIPNEFVKDRTNCHIILLAKNEEGRRDINEILSVASIDGFYGQPRIDINLLLHVKPENIMVTTACLKYWAYNDIDEITEKLYRHFKDNFFLEIQYHNTDIQKKINKRIIDLHDKFGIKLILGCDSHYIYPDQYKERDNYLEARGITYDEDEQGWYMDYPDEQEARRRLKEQGILTDEQIDECIKNTDILLDFDDIVLNKNIKLPKNYLFNGEWVGDKSQEWRDTTLHNLVYSKWNEIKNTVSPERYKEYKDGIEYELNAIIDTKMADYFLIDYELVKTGVENGGIITKTGRGSGVSYYVNSLLGFSNIDRFISPVKLYPDRFISKTRILKAKSLPDLDLNLGTPEIFADAQIKVMGEGHAYPMISYKPLQVSSAFKLYAKSQGLDFEISNEITSQIKEYEKALKNAEDDMKDSIDLYTFVDKKYKSYIDESKKYRGIINSKSQAPCGYLIYDGDIKREVGLIRCKSEATKKEVITTVIDGMVAENYKFVKNDLLKVDIWLTINNIFKEAGVKTPTVPEMTKLIENDKKTWDVYSSGYTLGINQCESSFGVQCCKKYKPQNMMELTSLVAALRPGFKTQLNNFLNRLPYTTGVTELDNLLKDSFHYMMYQESIMTYLGWLGIEQTETYAIIKKISKKKFKEKELAELKAKLLKGWVKNVGSENGFEKTWEIIEAASKYSFNASHALSYGFDSVYGAYCKAHYPYEFYAVMMQHYSDKGDKDKVSAYKKEMFEYAKIRVGSYKFGLDNRKFSIDKNNGCINPSLSSIKNFSTVIANTLYKLGKDSYSNLSDLFVCLKTNGIADSRIKDLINIDYFSDYGDIKYLLNYFDIFMKFYKNKKYLSQFKKDKAFEFGIDFDVLRKHCGSETVKTFMKIDSKAIIDELAGNFDEKVSLKEKLLSRYEVLGYMDIVDKKYAGYCFVEDLNVDYSPKVKLYALANGNTIPVKISKKIFKQNPVKRGDIVKVTNQHKEPKKKKIDGQWQKIDEQEWWVTEYQIC